MSAMQASEKRGLMAAARKVGSVMLTALLVATMLPAVAWAAPVSGSDVSWYVNSPDADEYELSNIQDLAGLALLVNGEARDGQGNVIPAQTFQGKTIVLTQNINGRGADFTPIGGQGDAIFDGVFDGCGYKIDNIVIDGASDANIGLFGKTGEHSVLRNVTLGSYVKLEMVRSEESRAYLEAIGLLVGYCEGSMTSCSSAGEVVVDSAVAQKSAEDPYVVEMVGGLAGVVYGDVANCSFSGTVDVDATSEPVSEYDEATLVRYVAGIVACEGDVSQMGETSTADSHGSIENCCNSGSVYVDTPSEAGTDRFGQMVVAQSAFVGGVAAYSRGSVLNCTNTGYVRAPNADIISGIVASFRSVEANGNANYSSVGGDEGSADDPIVLKGCVNGGVIYGRAAAGGIAGQSGTYATVVGCVNASDAYVVATRWNKPAPGGIVGRVYGTVCYCVNLGTVASAVWDNEDLRTFKKSAGYYCGGIAGMTLGYTAAGDDGNNASASPVSEVYNCYNAGPIVVQSGFRSRNIVGNNEGYAHDNVALSGMCDQDMCVYGVGALESDTTGSFANNVVVEESVLKSSGKMTYKYRVSDESQSAGYSWATGEAESVVSFLNSGAEAAGWAAYWVDANGDGANKGFPVLDWQAASYQKTDLSRAALTLVANAKYCGSQAVPTVSAKLNGKTLVQGVDFKVIPDENGIAVTSGTTPYKARIEGVGWYEGTSIDEVSYGIDKGDLSACSAIVESKLFNWEAQEPQSVTVKDAAGNVVPATEYEFALSGSEKAVNAGLYDVIVSAKEGSALFEGSTTTLFRIEAVGLGIQGDVDLEATATVSYMGKSCKWVSQSNGIADSEYIPTYQYTGYPIEPTISGVEYLNRPLEEGRDYAVVYGSLGGDESDEGVNFVIAENNIGVAGGSAYGAIMIRWVPGGNFRNYDNMVFSIVDTGEKLNLEDATVEAPTVIYENQAMCPVVVSYGGAELAEGVDYAIVYQNNDAPGTASYVVTGIGMYEGTLEGTFEITDDPVFDFTFTTDDASKTAVVTGFSYNGIFDMFKLVIPSTVERSGVTYAVTAIGDGAFGGKNDSDFRGTDKLRIESVYIPASVESIGEYAFGSNGSSVIMGIRSVEFERGSKLVAIGKGAFKKCKELTSFTFPSGVSAIGDEAFHTCSALALLKFETTAADMPSSVGSKSFYGVGSKTVNPVRVLGNACAARVQELTADNASANTMQSTNNGGHYFKFYEYGGSLEAADVSGVVDVEYTGKACTQNVVVKLNGKTLVKDVDYTVSYENNVQIGTATMTIVGCGVYDGSLSIGFGVTPASISAAKVEVEDAFYVVEGVAPEPGVVVTLDGVALEEGVDFSVVGYENNELPGNKATVLVGGMGNYAGTACSSFYVQSPVAIAFTDVTDDPAKYPWYIKQGALDYAYDQGLISGYKENGVPTGLIGAEDGITRAQVVEILYRMADGVPGEELGQADGYRDTSAGAWYENSVRWAQIVGIATGDVGSEDESGRRTFRPDACVNRAELATMLARFYSYMAAEEIASDCALLDAMPDASMTPDWARANIGWCMDNEIITGVEIEDEAYVKPLDEANRAQMAKMARAVHRDLLGLYVPSGME